MKREEQPIIPIRSDGEPSSFSASVSADEVIADVVRRRALGEYLPDAAVAQSAPHLMPQLGERLSAIREIHRTCLDARRAGPLSGPLRPLSEDELEKPIDSAELDVVEPAQGVPRIDGYCLMDEISFGGQATVYKAVQQSTGRKVAVKVLAGGPFVSSRTRVRFEREAQILAALDHPHIVGIVDRGRSADGSFYLVMDYIEGYCLDEYLAEDPLGRLEDVRAVLGLFCQIARAVDEAHQHGVIHRDLKPSNVRIDRRGEPHVLDFGLARLSGGFPEPELAQSITQTGQFVGSLQWASPEQVSHGLEGTDARSDVYALGVMLYHALTGVFPYDVKGSIRDALNNIATALPVAPSGRKPNRCGNYAEALDGIVLQALAKSPSQRHRSARHLAEDLDRVIAGVPPRHRPDRRSLRRSAALAAAVLLAGGLAAAGWQILHRPQGPVPTAAAGATTAREPLYTNSIGMRFTYVPAGEFLMGSPPGEAGRDPDELPHPVQMSRSYLMAVTEVTQAQYRAVVGVNPSAVHELGDDLPVQCVSWEEANAFCRALSQKERLIYRLPSQTEWEYACRAGTSGPYAGDLFEMGWFKGNSAGRLHPAAGKRPNAWGLYDMHGNVQEWCADAPTNGLQPAGDPVGNPQSLYRVTRGGSFASDWPFCRSARPIALHVSTRDVGVGFRVLLELNEPLRSRLDGKLPQ